MNQLETRHYRFTRNSGLRREDFKDSYDKPCAGDISVFLTALVILVGLIVAGFY